MTKFVTLKRGGEPGKVAVNPALVTEVRSSSGAYVDIHFGAHRVAVEGTLQQVVALLSGAGQPPRESAPADSWLTMSPPGPSR